MDLKTWARSPTRPAPILLTRSRAGGPALSGGAIRDITETLTSIRPLDQER